MDKNNRKGFAHTTNQNTHLLTALKKEIKRATQKSLPFGKWKLWGKRSQENRPKAENDKT